MSKYGNWINLKNVDLYDFAFDNIDDENFDNKLVEMKPPKNQNLEDFQQNAAILNVKQGNEKSKMKFVEMIGGEKNVGFEEEMSKFTKTEIDKEENNSKKNKALRSKLKNVILWAKQNGPPSISMLPNVLFILALAFALTRMCLIKMEKEKLEYLQNGSSFLKIAIENGNEKMSEKMIVDNLKVNDDYENNLAIRNSPEEKNAFKHKTNISINFLRIIYSGCGIYLQFNKSTNKWDQMDFDDGRAIREFPIFLMNDFF